MKTLLTLKQQKEHLSNNRDYAFIHKWSARGYGSSRLIISTTDEQGAYRNGCGYDRFGASLGDLIEHLFKPELIRLAKRFAKTRSNGRKSSKEFYGLFVNQDGDVYLDGACGDSCMQLILNAIGFSLVRGGDTGNAGQAGSVFYYLKPVNKHTRDHWLAPIK